MTRLLKSGVSPEFRGEVKLLEDQLIQNQKFEALGRLTRGIAHDFNNVINIIATRTHLLGIEIGSGPGQAHVQAIRHASERATALTRQLVAFSRRQTLDPKPLNLNAVVQRTSAVLERLLDPQIELRLNLGPHLWDITADADQMIQVVMNLCLNARDAMPQGGTIGIQTRNVAIDDEPATRLPQHLPGSTVLLTVTDSGSGITPVVREHMFGAVLHNQASNCRHWFGSFDCL